MPSRSLLTGTKSPFLERITLPEWIFFRGQVISRVDEDRWKEVLLDCKCKGITTNNTVDDEVVNEASTLNHVGANIFDLKNVGHD